MSEGKTATILKIAVGVLCLAVIGLGGWLWKEKTTNSETQTILIQDKESMEKNLEELKSEYSKLQTNNDSINDALAGERYKVDQLLQKVKQTEASNVKQLRQYEKELGTLRAIMRSYIVQIDSLNTANQALMVENVEVKKQAHESHQKYEEVSKKAEELTQKVQIGSALKARGLSLVAVNKKGNDTEKASKARKLRTCVTLIENALAEKGIKTVFVRIKGPDGIVLTTSENNLFEFNGEQIVYSDAREVDYQGEEIEVCVYYDFGDVKIAKGIYDVTAYSGGSVLGTAQLRLK